MVDTRNRPATVPVNPVSMIVHASALTAPAVTMQLQRHALGKIPAPTKTAITINTLSIASK